MRSLSRLGLIAQPAKMADDDNNITSMADLWIRANAMCGCSDSSCNIVWRGGCSGKAEVDYTSDGRVLHLYCLDCEDTIMRIELPEHAMERSGGRAKPMSEMKCQKPGCTETHGVVLQQICHPHAGKVVRYYKNRDYFALTCFKCDAIVTYIHVGTPEMMAKVEQGLKRARGRAKST